MLAHPTSNSTLPRLSHPLLSICPWAEAFLLEVGVTLSRFTTIRSFFCLSRVAQHNSWLGHSFSMSYCVAYSFDLLDFRCNTEPLNCISDIMLTCHHCSRYTMQSSFIPASIMRACGAQIGSRTIVFNYHYRYRLFLSC
jgi:hypothetical protein